MTSCNVYSLKWLQACLVMGLLSLMLPAQAATEAALVLFSHGNVVLTNNSGSYPLEKGASVASGDTVITGEDGRIQMRFSDGGLVSLMPNSRFAVEEYSQPTASSEGSASVNLLKGGMRALSGSIGKKDQDSYKLKTDVATLGIRGTQFVVVMDGAAMRVHVGQGSVSLFNDFGELLVPAGMHAEVFPGQAPVISTTAPVFMSADKPILQDSEEQQREANQSPTSASRYASTDVMRTLDPDIIRSVKNDDKNDGSINPNPVDPNPVDPNPVDPNPVDPNPVDPNPIDPNTETYDGGLAIASLSQSVLGEPSNPTQHEVTNPTVNTFSVEQFGRMGQDYTQATETLVPQYIRDNQTQTDRGLFWAEDAFINITAPGNPLNQQTYQTYIWGHSLANMPTTGTLYYQLSRQQDQTPHATPIRTIFDNNPTVGGENHLMSFGLEIQLGQQTKFIAEVQTDSSWYFYNAETTNGHLNLKSGEFHFNINDPQNYQCPSCSFEAAGFLSGDQTQGQQGQAGIVYIFNDNDGISHTGGAVLDQTGYSPNVP